MIDKHTSYKFHEVFSMPLILKELLYHTILYDYGVNVDKDSEDTNGVFNLDTATPDQIRNKLGVFNERKQD